MVSSASCLHFNPLVMWSIVLILYNVYDVSSVSLSCSAAYMCYCAMHLID